LILSVLFGLVEVGFGASVLGSDGVTGFAASTCSGFFSIFLTSGIAGAVD
jgi:hypothetical protein